MKKTVASTLTAAVILGMASTSFAAPVDDEVAALKARVAELERMIREQQQQNNNNAQKSEVRNLDSRVTELEDKSSKPTLMDKFNITGELRYRYWNRYKNPDFSRLELRLFPTFTIDEHFAVKARLTGKYDNFQDDTGSGDDWKANFAYLESKYGNLQVNAGKLPLYTNADKGLIADDFFSGVQVMFGNKAKVQINGGSWSTAGNYIGAEVNGKFTDSLSAGVGYHHFKRGGTDDKQNIIAGGLDYKFNPDFGLFGSVAHNTEADNDKTAYNIEANYKGANKNEKASWGAYVAYRYIPSTVSFAPTYDTYARDAGKKGFELGTTWTPYKNTLTKFAYFHGKKFNNAGDDRTFFARASFFF